MMEFHNQNVKEARENVKNRMISIQSSNDRIRQPYYPPLITKNRSGQPFFASKDESTNSDMSFKGSGFRLSDVDYEIQRKKILERLSSDYQKYNVNDTTVDTRKEKILTNDDVAVYVSDLVLDNIINKLVSEKFNKDLINELNKFRGFIISNVYRFQDFNVFKKYIEKLQQILTLLRSFQAEGIQKNIKYILGSIPVDRNTLEQLKKGELPDEFVVDFSTAFDEYIYTMTKIIETLIDYLSENSKAIGQSVGLRKQLAAALVKSLGISDKSVNLINKKVERNFDLLEKEFAPIPLGPPLKTDAPLTRAEKQTQQLIELLTQSLQKQAVIPTPSPAPPPPTPPTTQTTQSIIPQITPPTIQPPQGITQTPTAQTSQSITPVSQPTLGLGPYLRIVIKRATDAGLNQSDISDIVDMAEAEYKMGSGQLSDTELDDLINSYLPQQPITLPATTTTSRPIQPLVPYLSKIIKRATDAGLDQDDIDEVVDIAKGDYKQGRELSDTELDIIINGYVVRAQPFTPQPFTPPPPPPPPPPLSTKQKREQTKKAVIAAAKQIQAQQAQQASSSSQASSSQASSSSQPLPKIKSSTLIMKPSPVSQPPQLLPPPLVQPPPLTPQQKAAITRAQRKAATEALKRAAAQRLAPPVSKTPKPQQQPSLPLPQTTNVPKGGADFYKMTIPPNFVLTERRVLNLNDQELDRLILEMTGNRTPLNKLKRTLNERLGLQNTMQMKDAILFVLYMNNAIVDEDGDVTQDEPNYFTI